MKWAIFRFIIEVTFLGSGDRSANSACGTTWPSGVPHSSLVREGASVGALSVIDTAWLFFFTSDKAVVWLPVGYPWKRSACWGWADSPAQIAFMSLTHSCPLDSAFWKRPVWSIQPHWSHFLQRVGFLVWTFMLLDFRLLSACHIDDETLQLISYRVTDSISSFTIDLLLIMHVFLRSCGGSTCAHFGVSLLGNCWQLGCHPAQRRPFVWSQDYEEERHRAKSCPKREYLMFGNIEATKAISSVCLFCCAIGKPAATLFHCFSSVVVPFWVLSGDLLRLSYAVLL